MRRTTFNRRITLLKLKGGDSRTEAEIIEQRCVWADVSEPSITTKLRVIAADQNIEYTVKLLRSELKGATHVQLNGKRYKIAQTGGTENPLHVRLLLERG